MESLPVSDIEHMGRTYIWRASKSSRRVHILNSETGRTFCQVENCGGKPFDGRGAEIPTGRRLCGNCIDLAGRDATDYRESSLAVLLGERLAETEPELFDEGGSKCRVDATFERACTVAPKPWKRKKQMRPAHGGKPKRSEAKYPRPFNDDLPW